MLDIENNKLNVWPATVMEKLVRYVRNKVGALLLIALSLSGCEADLNIQGVELERAKNSIRTDQYQEMVLNHGVITLVGSQGLVMTSDDQGKNWQRQIISGKPNFIGIAACPDKTLIALSFDRRLWTSIDNGKQWTEQTLPTSEDVMDISCAPDGSYWVTGSFSSLLYSRDQGSNWQQNSFDEDALLTHIEFFDNKTGIVAGEFGLFYKTTDGGASWNSIGIIGDELYPLAIHFNDVNTGWAGGLSGVIMKTDDGGSHWTQQKTAVKSPIYRFINNGEHLYATGDHGSILVLQGEYWQQLESPKIPVYLSTGVLLDNKQLLVAGGWGALFSIPTEIAISSNN